MIPPARRGYRVLCVELGANLAAIARGKLADHPDARVLASSFEGWPLAKLEGAFDLVVSATAFHWADPSVRYRKSARALRSEGSLALIWNTHDPEGSSEGFAEALDDVHRRAAPELAPERRPLRLDREPDKAGEIGRSGYFGRPEERRYRFGVARESGSYPRLLGTHSSHRALEGRTRQRLFAAVARPIDEGTGAAASSRDTAASSTSPAGSNAGVGRHMRRGLYDEVWSLTSENYEQAMFAEHPVHAPCVLAGHAPGGVLRRDAGPALRAYGEPVLRQLPIKGHCGYAVGTGHVPVGEISVACNSQLRETDVSFLGLSPCAAHQAAAQVSAQTLSPRRSTLF